VGGQRPAHLLALEGQPAPGIRAAEWLGGTAAAFGVRMWPMSVVIDRAGRVRAAGIRPDRIPEIVGRLMAERLEAPAAGNDA
jgi:hypothetical protein